jgi:hypothetical protein
MRTHRPSLTLSLLGLCWLFAAPNFSHAGEITVGQYMARQQTVFSDQLVGACLQNHRPSAQELDLAYSRYRESTDKAMAKFLATLGRDGSIPAPGGEESLKRLSARATEFLRTVDLPSYCPQLAARLTTATPEVLYAGMQQSWEQFKAQGAGARQQAPK